MMTPIVEPARHFGAMLLQESTSAHDLRGNPDLPGDEFGGGPGGAGAEAIASPLALDGWLCFNRRKWGLRPERLRYAPPGSDRPAIEVVLYLDPAGRVRWPPRTPYLAAAFRPTDTDRPDRLDRQWLEVGGMLARDMRRRGLAGGVPLPPEVVDARPWAWAGFRVRVEYTYQVDLPHDLRQADPKLRTNMRKAQRAGYACRRTADLREVLACLTATERRQRFSHQLSLADLELAQALLGPEHFRANVCYAPDGSPASADVTLHLEGTYARGWLHGTADDHLTYGASQLLYHHLFTDLAAAGATVFDFVGADIPALAAAKAAWGARLVPYYVVEGYAPRTVARFVRDWAGFWQRTRRDR